MAAISWSIVGMQFSEADRNAAAMAGDIERDRLMRDAIARQKRQQALDSQLYPANTATGARVPSGGSSGGYIVTPREDWPVRPSYIPANWIYAQGVWRSPEFFDPQGLTQPSAQVVSSASTVLDISFGGPKVFASLGDAFLVAPNIEIIRMSTGIGAGIDGALTPVREGIRDMPRIIIGDQYT